MDKPKFAPLEHQYVEAAYNGPPDCVGITDTNGQRWLLEKTTAGRVTIRRGNQVYRVNKANIKTYQET